jgi:predicted membrane protein
MIIFTFLLNMLCAQGLGIVSWILVFIPFMLMSLITAILLYVFGLDPYSGKIATLRKKNSVTTSETVTDSQPQTNNTPIQINATGNNKRPGTNDVIGNTFDSAESKFDKMI